MDNWFYEWCGKKPKKKKCLCNNCQKKYIPKKKGRFLIDWDYSCPKCGYQCYDIIEE